MPLPSILAALSSALLTAVGPGSGPASAQEVPAGEPLVALAAVSLSEVLPTLASAWEEEGGVPITFSFAATSRLAPQADRAGGADLFFAADRRWMAWLSERDRTDGAGRVLFGNALVVVTPANGGQSPRNPAELIQTTGPLALAGEDVPAGRYAQAALLAAGVWEALEPRVVRGGSVRGTLEWVARGEASAGVVYYTDAEAEPRVEVAFSLDAPDAGGVEYSGAVLRGASRPAEARGFLDFLSTPRAGAIIAAAGFVVAPTVDEVGGGLAAPQSVAALPDPIEAVRVSMLVGIAAMLLGLIPAVAVGWLLARRPFPGKALVTTVVLAPLVMPPVVTGFLLLSALGREGPLAGILGAVGLSVPFTLAAPILAALVVGFPLYVVAVRGAFEAVDPRYEEVSLTLGVPPARTFLRVSIPLALPGIVAGAVLAFARALGEFGATIVLAGNIEGRTRTIALAVYSLLESPTGQERMWVLVGASVGLSLAALLGYEALSRRQRRRLVDGGHGR